MQICNGNGKTDCQVKGGLDAIYLLELYYVTGHIKVKFNNSTYAVFTDENGKVPLENLKDAVPSADGLQYREQSPPFALMKLPCTNGLIKLITNVTEYEAFSNSSFSKVNEMVDKIRNSRGCKSNTQLGPSPALFNEKFNEVEKSMIASRKKNPKLSSHPKKIKIGFLFQAQPSEPYKSFRKMTGGTQYIELLEGHFYNAQQVLNAGVDVYSSPVQNQKHFECVLKIISASILRLGDAEGYEDINFNLDYPNYGFWEYLSAIGTPPSKVIIYILAEKKAVVNDPVLSNMTMVQDIVQNEFVEQLNIKENADDLAPKENLRSISGIQQNATHAPEEVQIVSEKDANVNLQQNIDRINVIYQHVTWSQYTGNPSIIECNFEEAYSFVQANNPECPPYSEFDPAKNGFRISKIEKNDQLLLDITLDENVSGIAKYNFKFPALENDLIKHEPHSILYDCPELFGQLEDGSYAVGCITFCDSSCQPTFKWIKNGELYKSQAFLYVLRLDDGDDSESIEWTCQVECMHTELERYLKDTSISLSNTQPMINDSDTIDEVSASTSKSINQNLETENKKFCIDHSTSKTFDQVLTFEDVSNIVIMEKKKLHIWKTITRQVGPMKERKGTYLGTDVSIKTFEFDEETIELIKNEIRISKIIKHPNIIMLMGIAIEPKVLHLITEKFEAQLLIDAIFDDAVKNYIKLDVDKKIVVAKQICQAVAYIHEQTLICKNISPFDILINENYQIKLRDIGINSKLKEKYIELMKLSVYEAPEIVLRNKPESLASDTWSLACVLFELFSGKRVFDIPINNNDNLKNELKVLMESRQKPKTSLVYPKDLQAVLNLCFNYDAVERPQVSIILPHFLKK